MEKTIDDLFRQRSILKKTEMYHRRASKSDAWAATRDKILEVDDANLAYPLYVEKAQGAYVWDVDGQRYIDYNLGYGPIVLGHGRHEVLASYEHEMRNRVCISPMWTDRQFELTELLVDIIPCAEFAYLLRTGSDATAAAVRLCRIATGRDKIAKWGYNGWHDWTAPRSNGIPKAVQEQTLEFEYNDVESLRRLFAQNPEQIACVIMMTYLHEPPNTSFLNDVKQITHDNGALFVLDEMRSGFRISLGGAQEHFGVVPDVATFSKAMANGFVISAVVGSEQVMKGMAETHMSSTFYANSPEMAAALTTIDILQNSDVIKQLWRRGEILQIGLSHIVDSVGLEAQVVGLPISPFLEFEATPQAQAKRSTFFAEVTKAGVLLHPNHPWYLSAAHTDEDVQETLEICRVAAEHCMASPSDTTRHA